MTLLALSAAAFAISLAALVVAIAAFVQHRRRRRISVRDVQRLTDAVLWIEAEQRRRAQPRVKGRFASNKRQA